MDFSWSDTFRACLPCSRFNRADDDDDLDQQQGGQRDELEGLLFNSDHDATDVEAETMSLRSDVGVARGRGRKRKKGKKHGSIRLFGFDLFGRPRLPSVSPTRSHSDDDNGRSPVTGRPRSSSAIDSDASPLEESTIQNLSADPSRWEPEQTEEDLAREEEEQRLQEERRAKRLAKRAKREARKEAELRANAASGFGGLDAGEEFEGFPGSGNARRTTQDDEFGPYVHVEGGSSIQDDDDDDADEDIPDLGGGYLTKGHARSNSGSDSRSKPNGPRGQPEGFMKTKSPHLVPLPPSSGGSDTSSTRKPKKSKSKKPSSAARSQSSTSQSPSLPSPQAQSPSPSPVVQQFSDVPASPFAPPALEVTTNVNGSGGFPSTGFSKGGFPSPGLGGSGGFPSPGLGRSQRKDGWLAGQGVALANRGDA
jgi:hypothetical protein